MQHSCMMHTKKCKQQAIRDNRDREVHIVYNCVLFDYSPPSYDLHSTHQPWRGEGEGNIKCIYYVTMHVLIVL